MEMKSRMRTEAQSLRAMAGNGCSSGHVSMLAAQAQRLLRKNSSLGIFWRYLVKKLLA
jgi:hydroxymethylglutaryl-CoA reductase